ncbi:hypothetical protein MTO96_013893 [Rhipicephalus appendiculatus]
MWPAETSGTTASTPHRLSGRRRTVGARLVHGEDDGQAGHPGHHPCSRTAARNAGASQAPLAGRAPADEPLRNAKRVLPQVVTERRRLSPLPVTYARSLTLIVRLITYTL